MIIYHLRMLVAALKKYKAKGEDEERYTKALADISNKYLRAGEFLISQSSDQSKDK